MLLGALVKAMGLEDLDWDSVLKELIPEKLLDLNSKLPRGARTVMSRKTGARRKAAPFSERRKILPFIIEA